MPLPFIAASQFSFFEASPVKISIQNIRVVQQCGGLNPAESFLSLSPQMLLHIKMKRSEVHAERGRISVSVSVFRKAPAKEAYCVLLPHSENYAIGCGAPVIVVYGRATRESHWQSGHWSLEGLCLGVGSIELNRESIFFFPSVCVRPLGPALPCTAWSAMSCCPDESKAFCGWAHSSSAVGPQL